MLAGNFQLELTLIMQSCNYSKVGLIFNPRDIIKYTNNKYLEALCPFCRTIDPFCRQTAPSGRRYFIKYSERNNFDEY